jgi:hypothetical protein
MTWKKHPRHITDEQFSDGTTIDGNRIDTALSDVVRRFNAVEKGDLSNRFVQTQYVSGWSPQTTAAKHSWPWLTGHNTAGFVAGSAPDSVSNPYRTKGYQTPGMDVSTTGSVQKIWSTSYYMRRPAILSDLVLFMHIDNPDAGTRTYANTFKYGSSPPEGFSQYDGNKDFAIVVSADSPFSPEDRSQNNVVLHRANFDLAREWVTGIRKNSTTSSEMYPQNPPWCEADTGGLWGVCLPLRDLNAPIPRDTRVRIDVVIPQYAAANVGGWETDNPWAQQRFDMAVTFLEEVEV